MLFLLLLLVRVDRGQDLWFVRGFGSRDLGPDDERHFCYCYPDHERQPERRDLCVHAHPQRLDGAGENPVVGDGGGGGDGLLGGVLGEGMLLEWELGDGVLLDEGHGDQSYLGGGRCLLPGGVDVGRARVGL